MLLNKKALFIVLYSMCLERMRKSAEAFSITHIQDWNVESSKSKAEVPFYSTKPFGSAPY
jgi:hypothetical protein